MLLPGYSRIQFERERLRSVYLATMTVVGAIVMPIAWGVAGASHEVIAASRRPVARGGTGARHSGTRRALHAAHALRRHHLRGDGDTEREDRHHRRPYRVACALLPVSPLRHRRHCRAFALSELTTQYRLPSGDETIGCAHANCRPPASLFVGLVAGIITGLALFGLHLGLGNLGWPAPAVLAVQLVVGTVSLLVTVTKPRAGWVWQEVRSRLAEAGYRGDDSGAAAWLTRINRFA